MERSHFKPDPAASGLRHRDDDHGDKRPRIVHINRPKLRGRCRGWSAARGGLGVSRLHQRLSGRHLGTGRQLAPRWAGAIAVPISTFLFNLGSSPDLLILVRS